MAEQTGASPPTSGSTTASGSVEKPSAASVAKETGAVATPPTPGPSTVQTSRASAGEPLASANARRGIEKGLVDPGEVLVGVQTTPMPVQSRTMFPDEGKEYHYHWFGDDAMRIAHAKTLGYEVVKGEDGEPMKLAGQVAMRVPYNSFAKRKHHIQRTVTPARERAPRDSFLSIAENAGVEAEDKTVTHRGPMSSVAGEGSRD